MDLHWIVTERVLSTLVYMSLVDCELHVMAKSLVEIVGLTWLACCKKVGSSVLSKFFFFFFFASIMLKLMPDHYLLRCYSLNLAPFGFYRL